MSVTVPVSKGQDAAVIGSNIVSALMANSVFSAGMTATQTGLNTVTLTTNTYNPTPFTVSMADGPTATGVSGTDQTTAYAAATATPESYTITFSGTPATQTLNVSVTTTGSGTVLVPVSVSATDTLSGIATNVAAAINANGYLNTTYTATATNDAVTIAQTNASATSFTVSIN